MSLASGWICLHRKIREHWIWEDPEKLRAWIDILLMVNHEEKQIAYNGGLLTVRKGQKLTSLMKLAERWGWSRNRVDRFLRLLDEADMVTAVRTPNGTLLTVVNWELYQDKRDSDGATFDTTFETPNGATDDTTVGAQTTMNNNYNNEEQVCVELTPAPSFTPTLEIVKDYYRERGFKYTDPEKFWNLYESRHWIENGKPLKWKQRLAYWEASDQAKQEKQSTAKTTPISSNDIESIVAEVMGGGS